MESKSKRMACVGGLCKKKTPYKKKDTFREVCPAGGLGIWPAYHIFSHTLVNLHNQIPGSALNWDASWILRSFWGQVFEPSASGICALAVQNMVPELLRIGPILSVCVSVCLFNLIWLPFWTNFEQNSFLFSEKRSLKNGNLNRIL